MSDFRQVGQWWLLFGLAVVQRVRTGFVSTGVTHQFWSQLSV